jgi:uncharacterized protein (TIGR02266 family)
MMAVVIRRYSQEQPLDRRAAARHDIEITIEMRSGLDATIHATTDLSRGGAFFRDAVPYPVGTVAQLTFKLPGDDHAIRCLGEVVNVSPDRLGMGLRFLDLSADDAQLIDRFAQNSAKTNPRGKGKR